MTLLSILGLYTTLYYPGIEQVPCDYLLSYDETKSEKWYPNGGHYTSYRSMKPDKLKKIIQLSSTALQKKHFSTLVIIATRSTLLYPMSFSVVNKNKTTIIINVRYNFCVVSDEDY